MSVTLEPIERRVFGVLIEKALAQPSYYPMTINAIVTACNQKNNRDPAMELDEEAVWDTIEGLRKRGLVSRVLAGGGARVDRFKHEVRDVFAWDRLQQAVMAELLLRGPQTAGELRTRTERMGPFDAGRSVADVVDGFCTASPPLMVALPRQPGQSAVRYAHCLYPSGEAPTAAAYVRESAGHGSHDTAQGWHAGVGRDSDAARGTAGAPPPGHAPASCGQTSASAVSIAAEIEELRTELDALRGEVERVRDEVAELRRALGA
ncbi:MAG: YceH family protein [Phycisphaerae bacterium]